jgi:hypothetical protein
MQAILTSKENPAHRPPGLHSLRSRHSRPAASAPASLPSLTVPQRVRFGRAPRRTRRIDPLGARPLRERNPGGRPHCVPLRGGAAGPRCAFCLRCIRAASPRCPMCRNYAKCRMKDIYVCRPRRGRRGDPPGKQGIRRMARQLPLPSGYRPHHLEPKEVER